MAPLSFVYLPGAWYIPSMKSRANIFTFLGLSLLDRSIFAVTIGYFANSSVLSGGRISVLCCQKSGSWPSTRPGALERF